MFCENCKKEYKVFGVKEWKIWANRKERRYCSIKCSNEARIGKYVGEESVNWKGGLTFLQNLIRKSSEYLDIRKKCFSRDKNTSILSKRKGKLHHHHIKSYSTIIKENCITKENWRLFKHILFDINNVVTLIEKEHIHFHNLYVKVTTPEQFEEFKNNYSGGQNGFNNSAIFS